jgi:hypothetical protein
MGWVPVDRENAAGIRSLQPISATDLSRGDMSTLSSAEGLSWLHRARWRAWAAQPVGAVSNCDDRQR